MASDLRSEAIEQTLVGRFGRPMQFFEEVDSTNRVALEWAGEGAPEGALVVADHQTAGRGRKARDWASQPGKLLQFSLVLRPSLPVSQLGLLPSALGVACAEGIQAATGLRATLKWPNDVTIGGRKVAGILVETRVTGSRLEAAIAGIGINVGWSSGELPKEIAEIATSIAIELERQTRDNAMPPRAVLLARILTALEHVYAMILDESRSNELIALASARSEIIGRAVVVNWPDGSSTQGTATRLLSSGALEVVDSQGTHTVHAGQIEHIRSS